YMIIGALPEHPYGAPSPSPRLAVMAADGELQLDVRWPLLPNPSVSATAPSARRLLRHRFRPTTATMSRRPSASVRHFLHPADLHQRSGGHALLADESIDRPPPFKIQWPGSSNRRFTSQQWPTKQSAHP
ncbi:hypothetical protein ACLOJK_015077, partial [Asimina triloba]